MPAFRPLFAGSFFAFSGFRHDDLSPARARAQNAGYVLLPALVPIIFLYHAFTLFCTLCTIHRHSTTRRLLLLLSCSPAFIRCRWADIAAPPPLPRARPSRHDIDNILRHHLRWPPAISSPSSHYSPGHSLSSRAFTITPSSFRRGDVFRRRSLATLTGRYIAKAKYTHTHAGKMDDICRRRCRQEEGHTYTQYQHARRGMILPRFRRLNISIASRTRRCHAMPLAILPTLRRDFTSYTKRGARRLAGTA